MPEYFLPNFGKVSFTIGDIRLKSNLNINQTSIFTEKYFFPTNSGFLQSDSGPLGDVDGHIQLIPRTYKSEKPNKNTGIDKVHLKCDCINGSIVNGCREPLLYSFAMDKPPDHKI